MFCADIDLGIMSSDIQNFNIHDSTFGNFDVNCVDCSHFGALIGVSPQLMTTPAGMVIINTQFMTEINDSVGNCYNFSL